VALRDLVIDLDDTLRLSEFIDLAWAQDIDREVARLDLSERDAERTRLVELRHSSMRMARSRKTDFPQPRDTSSRSALFRLGDLVAWLEAHPGWSEANGRSPGDKPIRWDALWLLDRAEAACRRAHGAANSRRHGLGALLTFDLAGRRLAWRPGRVPGRLSPLVAPGDDVPSRLTDHLDGSHLLVKVARALVAAVPPASAPASRLARSLALALSDGHTGGSLADHLLSHLTTSETAADTAVTPDRLADLLAIVADPHPGDRVLDLAAGEGGTLLAISRHCPGSVLIGREVDPWNWRIGVARLHLHRLEVDLGDAPVDSLEVPPLNAEIVVADPPFAQRSYLPWVECAVRSTNPGGRAAIVVPARTLEAGRKEVRHVHDTSTRLVVLPGGQRAATPEPIAIWVINPAWHHDDFLLVDAGGLVRQGLDASPLAGALATWRHDHRVSTAPGLNANAIPTQTLRHPAERHVMASSWRESDVPGDRRAARRALKLARELLELTTGPLEATTTNEQRRALGRLVTTLEKSEP